MYNFNKNFQLERFLCTTFTFDNFLSDNEIDFIKKYCENKQFKKGSINGNGHDTRYRNNDVVFLTIDQNEDLKNFYRNIVSKIYDLNNDLFNFKLTDIEPLQYTVYTEGHFYKKHIDTEIDLLAASMQRKLSFSVQLTDEEDYDGGDLLIYVAEDGLAAPRRKGSATFFSSFSLHEVTPITRGKRESLVGWVWGPKFV